MVEYEFQNRTPNKKRYSFNEKVRGFHGCIYTYYIIIYIIYIYTSYLYIYISSYGYSWPGNSWLFCGSMWLRKVPLYLWLPCGLCFDGEAGELSKLVTAVSGSDSLNLADWRQKYAKKKAYFLHMFFKFCRCVQTLTRRQMFNRCSQLRHRRAYFLWQRLRCSIQTCWVVTAMKGNFT